jgi:hypothetical protein
VEGDLLRGIVRGNDSAIGRLTNPKRPALRSNHPIGPSRKAAKKQYASTEQQHVRPSMASDKLPQPAR